jgi:hypothetical protein
MDWFGDEQEELYKQEQEKYVEKPKIRSHYPLTKARVVTIYISMHGETMLTKPIHESNTVISGSIGLCQTESSNLKEKIDKINYAKGIYARYPTSVANSIYIENAWNPYEKGFMLSLPTLLSPSFITEYPNESRLDVATRYLKSYSENDFIRSYTTDKKYEIAPDGTTELFAGIYFIHSNVPMVELQTTCDDLIKDKSDKNYVQLQRYNLLNEEYSKRIAKRITGVPYSLNQFEFVSEEFRGIKKYRRVYLSSILYYFKKLGFDHVNIIDNSCNAVYTKTPPMVQRRISMDQKERGKHLTKVLNLGGKRKTKRKKMF